VAVETEAGYGIDGSNRIINERNGYSVSRSEATENGKTVKYVEVFDQDGQLVYKGEDNPFKYVVDKNGAPVMNGQSIQFGDSVPNVVYEADGVTVKTVANGETNVTGKNGGWYKLGDGSYARFWAWTAGEEKGNIFFVQVKGKNVPGYNADESTGHAVNGSYVNFAPGEPNDELWGNEKSQTALEVNHDTYYDAERGNVLVSKWDDMPDGSPQVAGTMKTNMKNYVVETEIGKTSLHIKAKFKKHSTSSFTFPI
jgi:hypothetical protein